MKPEPEKSSQDVLAGLIERVTYHNAETGFCVLRTKARGHRDVVTVVGHAAAIAAGEWITASGEWINDRTHGQQFKARFLRTSPPTSADGIEKYLSSGMIRGERFRRKGVRRHRSNAGPAARGCRHRAGSRCQHSRRLGRTEGGAGNHGLPTQQRCRYDAGGTDFQDLWCRRHPGHDRESISAGARYPRDRIQDRRRDRHEARHRKDGDDPRACGDFLCADRGHGRGPLRPASSARRPRPQPTASRSTSRPA
jgi:hypothetical protein